MHGAMMQVKKSEYFVRSFDTVIIILTHLNIFISEFTSVNLSFVKSLVLKNDSYNKQFFSCFYLIQIFQNMLDACIRAALPNLI